MTNKLDKLPGGLPPAGEPPSAPVHKPNSAGDKPDARAAADGSPLRRQLKGKTDVPMKNPGVDLKARQDVIGEGLKRIFDEIVEEPVPPEFLELLDQIDRKHEE